MKPNLKELLPAVENIARQAGAEIMKHYGGTNVYTKNDGSNVTDADHAAEGIILPALRKLTPHIPIVSEERVAAGEIPDISSGTFWVVDPLDGTHEFIEKTGAFVVAIALIVDSKPVMGTIYHPSMDLMYSGCGIGTASKTGPDRIRILLPTDITTDNGRRVLVSSWRCDRARIEHYLALQYAGAPFVVDMVSGIFRTCRIAEGQAEMFVACSDRTEGRIAFWDVAPGQAIVESAGGRVETLGGQSLIYDASDLHVPPYIALSPSYAKTFKIRA